MQLKFQFSYQKYLLFNDKPIKYTCIFNVLLRLWEKNCYRFLNSFSFLNVTHCELVCMFSNPRSLDKVESQHKRTLRIVLEKYKGSCQQLLSLLLRYIKETIKENYLVSMNVHLAPWVQLMFLVSVTSLLDF